GGFSFSGFRRKPSWPSIQHPVQPPGQRGGRLVANAVTLEMEAVLLAEHGKRGGFLTRIEISRAQPVGGMSGWRPAMPVTQWRWIKG
ncbi:hypothetical protein ACCT30_21385, partial [Rhizobium ruizarguesonis]